MILYATYCSREKNTGVFPPDRLYKSPRIERLINRCKTAGVNWAILSALYGLFFPDQEEKDYDLTFKSDRKYWLGIAVLIDDKKLPREESREHVKNLCGTLLKQASRRDINKLIFYAPNPRRAKCYLAVLHRTFDNCSEIHIDKELVSHLMKSEKIKVVKSLNEISL
jgi:hypothetical protein